MFSYRPEMKKQVVVDTRGKLKKLVRKMWDIEEFAFDTETNTLKVNSDHDDFSLVGISISWGEYNNYYIPVGHRRYEDYDRQLPLDLVVKAIKPIFERLDIRVIGWNLKFDMHVVRRVGIHILTEDLFDGMIASWLCDENTPNGLKENSMHYLGIKQTKFKEVTETVSNEVKKEFGLKAANRTPFDLVLIDDGTEYALIDAFHTWELYLGFLHLLEEEKMDKIYENMYRPFIRVLYDMEEAGVCVDFDRLKEMSHDINEDMKQLEYEILELAGVEFNPSSSQQLARLLFGYNPEPLHPSKAKAKGKQKPWQDLDNDERKKRVDAYKKKLIDWEKDNEWIEQYSFDFHVISETDGGAPQTNADVLWRLSRMTFKNKRKREGVELCNKLLEYKKLDKLRSAFIDGLFDKLYADHKAHPNYNIIGTDSGRLSCSEPNLQQLPRVNEDDKYQIRSIFVGREYVVDDEGHYVRDFEDDDHYLNDWEETARKKIIALDYANLEMRVLAHFSQDENLLKMFADNADTHGSTAVNMFNLDCDPNEAKKKYPHLRQAAKTINFMLMYGGGANRLYLALRDDRDAPIDLGSKEYTQLYGVRKGEDVAQVYIDKYFESYAGVAAFIKTQRKFAHRNEYVPTLRKRKRRLPDINGNDRGTVGYCERLAVNATIQGSAADITMSGQNRIVKDTWFEEHGCTMLLQVHDELVFECPEEFVEEAAVRIKRYMEHPFGDKVELNLPLSVDHDSGDSYAEAK